MIWAAIGSYQVLHQSRYLPSVTPGDYGLPWEGIRLAAEDGVPIAGWLLRRPAASGTILMFHGYGTGKADLLDVAESFYRYGPYHVILIDFRGHGASGGTSYGFGSREVFDVKAVLDLVGSDPELRDLPVATYGISMGGAISILAAALYPQIRAVVTDSAYAEPSNAIARAVWMTYHIPRIPLGQLVLWGTEIRLGCRLRWLSPARVVSQIAPRGILIIHGMNDRSVPHKSGEALYRSAAEPKTLWLVPGAEHVGSFYMEKDEYLRQVFGFLDGALRRTP